MGRELMPNEGAWIHPMSNTKLLVVPLLGRKEQKQGAVGRSGTLREENLSGGFSTCQRMHQRAVNLGGGDMMEKRYHHFVMIPREKQWHCTS